MVLRGQPYQDHSLCESNGWKRSRGRVNSVPQRIKFVRASPHVLLLLHPSRCDCHDPRFKKPPSAQLRASASSWTEVQRAGMGLLSICHSPLGSVPKGRGRLHELSLSPLVSLNYQMQLISLCICRSSDGTKGFPREQNHTARTSSRLFDRGLRIAHYRVQCSLHRNLRILLHP